MHGQKTELEADQQRPGTNETSFFFSPGKQTAMKNIVGSGVRGLLPTRLARLVIHKIGQFLCNIYISQRVWRMKIKEFH